MNGRKKAVILVSGGLDSTTVLKIIERDGFDIYALSVQYGQTHAIELLKIAEILKASKIVEHKVLKINLDIFGASALTDTSIRVPEGRDVHNDEQIPVTYVPARNTIFLSCALAYAESIGADDIFIGVNVLDYSGYPDCRPEYINKFNELANLALAVAVSGKSKIQIHTPLLYLDKAEIIKLGMQIGVDYSKTLSCYQPNDKGYSCGVCDACILRLHGFAENGLQDPIPYVTA